jgi:hypothetical protein
LNPRGPRLYTDIWRLGSHPNLATLTEWDPLGLRPGGWHRHYLTLLGLVALTRLLSPRRCSPTEVLLMGFAVPPPFQQRWMVWWILVAPWVMVPHWVAIASRLREGRTARPARPGWRMTALALQVLIACALVSTPMRWLFRGSPDSLDQALSEGTPWRLAETLRASSGTAADRIPALDRALRTYYPAGRFRGAIFPNELLGDYLIWALPPEFPVLAYAHPHAFSAAYWSRFRAAKFGGPGWREFLDARGVNLVVVQAERHPELRGLLHRDPAWQVVLDETGDRSRRSREGRLLIALRTHPI